MNHLKTLKLLNFAMAAYAFAAGLLFLIMFLLPWLIGDPDMPGWAFAVIGILTFILICANAAAHVIVGWLVGVGRGRIGQTVLAVWQLWSFPLGTLYGVYALWVCWVDEASTRAFDSAVKKPIT
jgi:hypothetical protein